MSSPLYESRESNPHIRKYLACLPARWPLFGRQVLSRSRPRFRQLLVRPGIDFHKTQKPRAFCFRLYAFSFSVPKAGIEPAHPKIHDFESCASTSSATLASLRQSSISRVYYIGSVFAPKAPAKESANMNKSLFPPQSRP